MVKIRQGFVSNSSSSSFIVPKMYMTKDERRCLRYKCDELGIEIDDDGDTIMGTVELGSDRINDLMAWFDTCYGIDNLKPFVRVFLS